MQQYIKKKQIKQFLKTVQVGYCIDRNVII